MQPWLDDFAAGNYYACYWRTRSQFTGALPHEALQLMLISLHRLELRTELVVTAELVRKMPHLSEWHRALVDVTLAKMDFTRLLPEATMPEQRCQLLFYAGALQATLAGSAAGSAAMPLFDECRRIGAPIVETRLAEIEAARMIDADHPPSPELKLANQLRLSSTAASRKDFPRAADIAGRALHFAIQTLGGDHLLTATLFDRLGQALSGLSRNADALACHEQALAIRVKAFGQGSPETNIDLHNVGTLLTRTGRHKDALGYLLEALTLRRALLGEDHRATASTDALIGDALLALDAGLPGDAVPANAVEAAEPIPWQRFDAEHAEAAARLIDLALLFQRASDTDDARFYLHEALAICRQLPGDHAETSTALVWLGGQWRAEGNHAEARACLEEALSIRRRLFGEYHEATAVSLHQLAVLFDAMGDHPAARTYLLAEVDALRRLPETNDSLLAEALVTLAGQYLATSELAASRSCLEEALSIRRRMPAEGGRLVAQTLGMLGGTLSNLNDHEGARSCLLEALDIERHAGGEILLLLLMLASAEVRLNRGDAARQHIAESLSIPTGRSAKHDHAAAKLMRELGFRLLEWNESDAARQQLERAWSILRSRSAEATPLAGQVLNDLGMTVLHQGEYSAARRFLEQSLTIQMKLSGQHQVETAQSLNNLGFILEEMGDYAGALARYEEALAVRRSLLGTEDPQTLHTINNIAVLLKTTGRYVEALEYYDEAVKIQRRAHRQDEPHLAVLTNLGTFQYVIGAADAARASLEESLQIGRKLWPAGDPRLGATLHTLALLLTDSGEYDLALRYFEEALALIQTRGTRVREEATVLLGMGKLYLNSNRPRDALQALERAARIGDFMIGEAFWSGSERQRKLIVLDQLQTLSAYLTLALWHFSDDPAVVRTAFDMVLRRKGISAEALAVQRDAVLFGRHPGLTPSLDTLRLRRAELARLTLEGPGESSSLDAYEARKVELRAEKERLESELAQAIPELKLEESFRSADGASVAEALPDGHALVEFVRFPLSLFPTTLRETPTAMSHRYVAFTLPAKQPDQLRMIDVGDAGDIDRRVAELRESIGGSRAVRHLTPAPASMDASVDTDHDGAIELRKKLFDSIARRLGNCRKLILAPDGELNRLPFGILPTAHGELIDSWSLSYVSVGRDLLRLSSIRPRSSGPAIVAAAPNYDLTAAAPQSDPATPVETQPPAPSIAAANALLHASSLTRVRDGLKGSRRVFGELTGAKREAEDIARILGVRAYTGDEVTSGLIHSWHSPWILHFATHGFFLEPPDATAGSEAGVTATPPWPARLAQGNLDNPLLCSGLALAGANSWLNNQPLPAEAGTGILTADDVTGLDLLDTALVVLSACDTGLGVESFAEGVLGLRRSFALAGAETVVMSLWKVPDAETRELMVDFYRRLRRGVGRAEALRQAQRRMKQKRPHVFFWGAFICQGDPSPLTWATR